MVSSSMKKVIWIIWFLIFPAGLWLTYYFYPPSLSGQGVSVFAFFILMSFVAAMPMVVNNTPVFLLQWVSMAVFLSFGLFTEMVMVQLAVIVLLFKLKIQKDQLFRFPLNSLMFFAVSAVSGLLYYALGGKTGIDLIASPEYFWAAVAYPAVHFILNQLLLSLIIYLVYGRKGSFFGKDLIWETITTLITFPVGLVLYILFQEVGLLALLFVGVPFVSLSIILNLYYSSEKVNSYLQKAAEIGHQLAERLDVNEIMELFISKLGQMLPVDYAYILDIVDDQELHLIYRVEHGETMSLEKESLKKNEGISGLVWSTKKAALFHSKKEWGKITKGYMPEDAESVICVPIMRNQKVTGVLLLASAQKRSYEKSQLMIVDMLCSHFAIIVENAKYHEETKAKSERCALTQLYNYRYIENRLSEEFARLKAGARQSLSLLILDIDYFKQVNDTYGHQSGNEILCELAERLTGLIGLKGTVARYGGEEFVVLLPDIEKDEAMIWAELVRKTVADRPFNLRNNLKMNNDSKTVQITASIGVAAAPIDAEDSLGLIRYADRAMYVGAKQAGRNRVAGLQF
ncbi:sensor domain-containing diguanylate cyclase [Bacillus sp. J33]|uniref:sensor domain-containing diguanylate cyclase n=1 Tax=Bacillus sp. J33 TaxID=935836 RepID=UPI0004BCBCCF|nr:sensor domain-containing diguanylate cyclase [Bacillus sp. J33]